MDYIKLGSMNLSRIILGCDRYGEQISKETAYSIINEYKNNGGNVLDTARMYTGGKSEQLIGDYLKETNSGNDFYISTKCAHYNDNISRLTRDDILYDVHKSLADLKVDYIDILWLHRDDVSKDVSEIMDTLFELTDAGIVKYIGASNWSAKRITDANNYAHNIGKTGFIASQILYNMAKCRYIWDDALVYMENPIERKFYNKTKMPVFAFSAQAKGFFEKYQQGSLSAKSKDRYYNNETLEIYTKILENSKKHNTTISYEALDMLVKQSEFEVFPIIGPSDVNQLKSTLNICSMQPQ